MYLRTLHSNCLVLQLLLLIELLQASHSQLLPQANAAFLNEALRAFGDQPYNAGAGSRIVGGVRAADGRTRARKRPAPADVEKVRYNLALCTRGRRQEVLNGFVITQREADLHEDILLVRMGLCKLKLKPSSALQACMRPHCPPVCAGVLSCAVRRYVLKNLTRDWGAEGAPERSQSYGRIAGEVAARLGPPAASAQPPRVLVPGAGLGRLCCDLAALGYEAQAREHGLGSRDF